MKQQPRTPKEKLEARRDNVIEAARLCVKDNFQGPSKAILVAEIARLDVELRDLGLQMEASQ